MSRAPAFTETNQRGAPEALARLEHDVDVRLELDGARRVHPLNHPLGILQLGLGLVQLRVDQRRSKLQPREMHRSLIKGEPIIPATVP